MPLAWGLSGVPTWLFVLVAVAITAAGVWAGARADAHWGTHDSGRIVIDEVAGCLVTLIPVARDDWVHLALGFALFRVFDIAKPPPIRALDLRVPGGLGVMLDDVAAGVMAGAVLYAISLTPLAAAIHARLG